MYESLGCADILHSLVYTQGACSFASEVIGLMPDSQVLPAVSSPPRGPASPARHTTGTTTCAHVAW